MLLLSTAIVSAGTAMTLAHPAFAADAAPAVTGLGEVVVTARKRDENLQTVPVSASVVSAVQLKQQNLDNFYDLRGAVPDLSVQPSQSGSGVNLSIRGVGAISSALVQSDPKIGLYLDDVFVARPEGNSLYFYDQAGLQVLYGPQGTLFGRNTSGGAILVTTNKPSASEGTSYAQVSFGNYNTINTEGGINVPINDTLLTRFSFRTQKSDGYLTHLLDEQTSDDINDQSARGQVRWTPTSKLTIDALYEHDESNTHGNAMSTLKGCTDAGYQESQFLLLNGVSYCSLYPPLADKYQMYGGAFFQGPTSTIKTALYTGGDYDVAQKTQYYRGGVFDHVDVDTANIHLTYEITPDIAIKSVSSYRHSQDQSFVPITSTPLEAYDQYNDQHTKAISEDLNLTGKAVGGRLNFVLGAYFYNQHSGSLQFDGTDYCDPAGWNDFETNHEKSYAAYGQASFDITDKFEVTAGGRFTYDKKDALGVISAANEDRAIPGCSTYLAQFLGGVKQCAGTLAATGHQSWKNFNPMASILYKLTPTFNVYATIRTSYDEGGFNAHSLSQVTNPRTTPGYALTGDLNKSSFDPDHFTDYEGGIKTEFFDHTLRFNLDVYYQKYKNLVSTTSLTIQGISTRVSQNAGDAHFEGVESTVDWLPTRDLRIGLSGYLIRGKYDKLVPGAINTTFNLETPVVGVTTPKSGYNINAAYTLHPYEQSELVVALNFKHQGPTLACQVGADYTCQVPAYALVGGRVTFTMGPDSPWSLAVYATNLMNKYWLINRNVFNPRSTANGLSYDTPGAPRMFGVTVKRTW